MRDFTLLGFIEHIAVMGAEMVVAEHEGLEKGAQIIEIEAKSSMGSYQAEASPFAAWAPLAESTKRDRVRQGYPEDEPELRSGRLRDTIEHVVIGHEAEIGSNDPIFEDQELGTARIPARSILGGAAVRKADEVAELIGEDVVLALMGGRTIIHRIESGIP